MFFSPQLPPEIIDAIIDGLQDEHTLKLCSLVSRACALRSQKNLFARINISLSEKRHCDALSRLVSRLTPRLASYIQHLRINDFRQGSRTYLRDHPVQLLFDKLRTLRSFTMAIDTDLTAEQSLVLSQSLVRMLHRTQKEDVSIHNLDISATYFVFRCPKLRRLDLQGSYMGPGTTPIAREIPNPLDNVPTMIGLHGKLEVLTLDGDSWEPLEMMYRASRLKRSCLTFDYLKELILHEDNCNALAFATELALNSGDHLKSLTWYDESTSYDDGRPLSRFHRKRKSYITQWPSSFLEVSLNFSITRL
ncbi:hypothetical protein H0H81_004860 [Sphagnurus paluster]|uniref:F-box domain-containing protein n=1 Tax=Sphagnurus paluster TaxID=117069 RepID=A0A9P7FND2_9AGAR|nr:hypothetical protein H0H81_004860 [Sphagnurus paluster]